MDQNRSENSTNQQQNVHLHMHHVCNCQSGIYPTYYPTVSYRTPVATMVPYPAPPAVARPYLQHYQYTQFNMGSQYTVPLTHVTSGTSLYGATSPQAGAADIFGPMARDRREKDSQEGNGDGDRLNEPPVGYDYGQVTPPANELLLTDSSEVTSPENFVKFLERSCLTAEQIAYRNRNRPCFRNIQNLCIRTRSEILKPCTTISNIHSQGIPWATKDFIYAFVRLTNCWHILKGYWENRDGSSLGKIEKELTPEFRACYVRWEKETIDLAAQLTRVFYNLDTNLNTPSTVNVHTANNLIPSQVNLLKTCSTSESINKPTDTITSKNVRGILHLPCTTTQTETVDQANQTCSGDFPSKEEEYESEEDARRIYMKPGSYNVPKKTSPRCIEFLETAQNVNKAREVANDRYWSNMHIGAKKNSDNKVTAEEIIEKGSETLDLELTHLNVHDWLISSNFSDFGEASTPDTSPQELRPFFVDSTMSYCDLNTDVQQKTASVTLLQRGKSTAGVSTKNVKSVQVNGRTEVPSRTYRKRNNHSDARNAYEMKNGGITDAGVAVLEKMLLELKEGSFGERLAVDDKNELIDLDAILKKLRTHTYSYINEVVRDLRYLINYMAFYPEHFSKADNKPDVFLAHKIDFFLSECFPGCDFNDIKGDLNEKVGPLKMKKCKFDSEENHQFL